MAKSTGSTTPERATFDMDDGRVTFTKALEPAVGETETKSTEQTMRDTSITKVNARYSPRGKHGQKYLAAGVRMSMRLWEDEPPGKAKPATQREYETVGYVIQGRAELDIEGQTVTLESGDSWIVPKGAVHRYKVLEPFTAVETTCPPAEVHGRDE